MLQPAEGESPRKFSSARKLVLLLVFGFAQFLDAFNNAALFPAIPVLEVIVNAKGGQSAWIISGFQLTFASFLLVSGRISDVYNPRSVFISGLAFLGILSTITGFIYNMVAFIVLRALMGIASALSIPSALALLVHVFPEPAEQARAIALLGGFGAIADVLGLFIGAVLVQYASYRWIFWFVAIVAISVALSSIFIIPPDVAKYGERTNARTARWKDLDLIGISMLTAAFILFIYAVTSGSMGSWATARVLIPFIISILLAAVFFCWETLIPFDKAAIPPRVWFYNNFSVLFGSALLPFFWWNAVFMAFTTLWQDVFHWTIVSTVVHMLPIGVAAFAVSFTGPLSSVFSPKWIILTGLSMVSTATVLIAVGGGLPEQYWSRAFPAFILGSSGTMLVYSHTNIAIFRVAPASMTGVVGAIFNGALQIGSAIGLAAFTSIETSVQNTHGGPQENHGRAASFWFLLGIVLLEFFAVACFYRTGTDQGPEPKLDSYEKTDAPIVSGLIIDNVDEMKKDGLTITEGLVFRVSLAGPNDTYARC